MKDWTPEPAVKKQSTVSYRRFLNAQPAMTGAVGFICEDVGEAGKSAVLQISDCRETVSLEFAVSDHDMESYEATRYKLDSLQEAINHLYDALEV